jgi:hypothetical protein
MAMQAPNRSGLRMVTLVLALGAGSGSLVGCHKNAAESSAQPGPNVEAVKQSFATVRKNFDGLQQRSADLAKAVEALPPDIPHYPQLRAEFYAFEEARGVTDAKVTLISGHLDSALKSGKADELQQVSNEIDKAGEDSRNIDQMYLKILHEEMAFERAAERKKDAVAATSTAPAPAAKTKPSKSASKH